MGKFIALLRGINVGGKNKVSMSELKKLLEENGFEQVVTYINSGNLVFTHELEEKTNVQEICETLILQHFQLTIPVTVLTAAELLEIAAHVPEWWGEAADQKHNALFVIPPATAQEVVAAVGAVQPEYEQVFYYGSVIFWTAGVNHFSRTRWSKMVGTKPYAQVTVRNANTFKKLVQIVQS